MTIDERLKAMNNAVARLIVDPRAALVPRDALAVLADLPQLLNDLDKRLQTLEKGQR